MIRFHFQFPRSPDAAFGGLIGWLFNLECKFSCRMISNIANHLNYNYFWDGDGIDNVTLRLWKFSDFCSRHTVGAPGDDIMFHIIALSISSYHQLPAWDSNSSFTFSDRFHSKKKWTGQHASCNYPVFCKPLVHTRTAENHTPSYSVLFLFL